MLVSIGDRVRAGTYRLHSVFKHAVNFEHRGRLVCVVDETVGPGPVNIVLRGLGRESVPASPNSSGSRGNQGSRGRSPSPGVGLARPEPSLSVTARTVHFAGCRYTYTPVKRYCSKLETGVVDLGCFQRSLEVLGEALRRDSHPKSLAFLLDGKRRRNFRAGFERAYAAQIQRGARLVFRGRVREGIGCLKGCGTGLTPGGDDFIAGLLIGLHLLQTLEGRDYRRRIDVVYRAARSQNAVSQTFLELARRGWLFGRMKDLVSALVAGSETAVGKAAGALFSVGETSGADLATGFFMTVRGQAGWGLASLRQSERLMPA